MTAALVILPLADMKRLFVQ